MEVNIWSLRTRARPRILKGKCLWQVKTQESSNTFTSKTAALEYAACLASQRHRESNECNLQEGNPNMGGYSPLYIKDEIARIIAKTRSARDKWVSCSTSSICVGGDYAWGWEYTSACRVKGEAGRRFGDETGRLALGPRLRDWLSAVIEGSTAKGWRGGWCCGRCSLASSGRLWR